MNTVYGFQKLTLRTAANVPGVNRSIRMARMMICASAWGWCLVALFGPELWAAPTTPEQAQQVVAGWLNQNQAPLETPMSRQIGAVVPYQNEAGTVIYYVVQIQPAGFVIVSADDNVEPIVSFSNTGAYDANPANPLYALTTADLNCRISAAQGAQDQAGQPGPAANLGATNAQKWNTLMQQANVPSVMGLSSVSDVWVAPLIQSRWSQSTVSGKNVYNYYTPNNYVCGCVATMMAQIMRFHQYPTTGVGTASFSITVSGSLQTASLRGGNGSGGSYNWSLMPLVPDATITDPQRQAIGALCYDSGVAVSMDYSSSGSSAYLSDATTKLKTVFQYSNSVFGYKSNNDITGNLSKIANPNLDAGFPVGLGIRGNGGHAVVCDGYGYDLSIMYYHLNLGWGGNSDAWYNLPNIGTGYNFDLVDQCVYNIYISGSGEIVSGRVVDSSGNPIAGVAVTDGTNTQLTNSKGIYAFSKIPSNQPAYTLTASKSGYAFSGPITVSVGTSTNYNTNTGNVWGVNFTQISGPAPTPSPTPGGPTPTPTPTPGGPTPTPTPSVGNDNFANRAILSGVTASGTGTNVGATKESGEPRHAGNDGGHSVWWTWTAPSSGSVTISTSGSDFDTLLGVYSGSAVYGLSRAAGNDNFGGNNTSQVIFPVTGGATYQIAVDGANGATGTINLTLSLYIPVPTPTAIPTPSPVTTPTPVWTAIPTPTVELPTATPNPTETATPVGTAIPTPTVELPTATPNPIETATPVGTAIPTPTVELPTATPNPTATALGSPTASPTPGRPSPMGPGDFSGDGTVGFNDLVALGAAWGSKPGDSNWNPNCDPTNTGMVGFNAMVILSINWNKVYR